MEKYSISIIAAIGKNRELGKDNKLLWHIPEDMKRFKKLTQGHAVIMGRKTFESIGKPLPNRINIVITRDIGKARYRVFSSASPPKGGSPKRLTQKQISSPFPSGKIAFISPNLIVCSSLKAAIVLAKNSNIYDLGSKIEKNEVFIIGGGEIYREALPYTDKLYLTIVDATADADTFFPDYSMFKKVVYKETKESNRYRYTFLDLER